MHVRDIGLQDASNEQVLSAALSQGRVLVTQDGDFPRMLAARRDGGPSVVLLKLQAIDRPEDQAPLILAAIREYAAELARGCVLVVEERGVRVHMLPLGTD